MLPLFADQGNIADTQIWIPDAELYNGAESLVETPPLALLVYNNGRVYFSRPHVYKINCSFKGATFYDKPNGRHEDFCINLNDSSLIFV